MPKQKRLQSNAGSRAALRHALTPNPKPLLHHEQRSKLSLEGSEHTTVAQA